MAYQIYDRYERREVIFDRILKIQAEFLWVVGLDI
jgi:hypothetical protein